MSGSVRSWWRPIGQGAFRVALIVCVVVLLVDLIRSVGHNYQISRQIRSLAGQITATQDRITTLKETIAYEQTASFRELTARQRLGLVKPGETLVLAPQNRDPSSPALGSAPTPVDPKQQARQAWNDLPPYQQWWQLFFGPPSQLEAVFGS